MNEPKRVLHILSSTMRAGVELMVMNYYREIKRSELQFDFIAHDLGEDDLGNEISMLGGRIFRLPLLSKVGIFRFVQLVYDVIIQNGPYIAIHAHTDYQGGFSALAAKKAGIPVRICHVHSDTRSIHSPALSVKKLLGRAVAARYSTQRCACSKAAGISLYGKRAVAAGFVKVIPNGILLDNFSYCPAETKEKLLHDCKAEKDSVLIGYVGRLNTEKNPAFILDIAAEAKSRKINFKFVFVGTGVMQEELLNRCKELGLDQVLFLGTRDDVPFLMQCLDVVVIPSFAEGFSLSALEAQAGGTPVLASSCIPNDADIGLDLMHFQPLSDGPRMWLEKIKIIIENTSRPDVEKRFEAIRSKGYDIKDNVITLLCLYGLVSQE